MTKIHFYILASAELHQRWQYAKSLVMQSLARGKTVHVHTGCARDTREFITTIGDSLIDSDERVSIDHKGEPQSDPQVLLNLSVEVPHFFSSFETVLEVVHSEPAVRKTGRERYRYYQDRGYPLKHYEITPKPQSELALSEC